jgi:hypothetical protein
VDKPSLETIREEPEKGEMAMSIPSLTPQLKLRILPDPATDLLELLRILELGEGKNKPKRGHKRLSESS